MLVTSSIAYFLFIVSPMFATAQLCPSVPSTPGVYVLSITTDKFYSLAVDGNAIPDMPNYVNYSRADNMTLPVNTRLLAVNARHDADHAGLLASVSNGYKLTDTSWKCTTTLQTNWTQLGFNDLSWPAAIETGLHGSSLTPYDYGCIPGISPYAYWIWTRVVTSAGEDPVIYCRVYLRQSTHARTPTPASLEFIAISHLLQRRRSLCQTASPCQNGGSCLANAEDLCVCPPDYSGQYCEIDMAPCRSSPCQNGATCVDGAGSYTCLCAPNYTGDDCETYINVCDSSPCQNSGTCVDLGGSYTCDCRQYYTGLHCETSLDWCASDPCLNGATCLNQPSSYTCTCAPFFTDNLCQTQVPYDCGDILHNANATVPQGWSMGCYIGLGDEPYWNTPCWALLQGLSWYGSSDGLLNAGGDFGCWATAEPSPDVTNACYPDYQQDITLSSCASCHYLAVCVQFP